MATGSELDLAVPTIDDVERIRGIQDPVVRNLQITQCYHELSAGLANRLGMQANWCTFATWASKQAGQTIRKQDLERLLERLLTQSRATLQASEEVAAAASGQGGSHTLDAQEESLNARNFSSAIAASTI
jgi:hypothetical protein